MKQFLKSVLSRLGYRVQGTRYYPRQLLDPRALRPLEFEDAICRLMHVTGKSLAFIQVGAFDGVTSDRCISILKPAAGGASCLSHSCVP